MGPETSTLRPERQARHFSLGQAVLAADVRATSQRDLRIDILVPFYRPWEVGQFVMLRWGRHLIGRPFAIVDWKSQPGGDSLLSVWVRRLGAATEELAHFKKGMKLQVTLPLGQGFSSSTLRASRLLLVSGGVGAASVLPLALARGIAPKDLWIHGDRDESTLDGELMSATHRPTYVCLETLPEKSIGFHPGRVTDLIQSISAENAAGLAGVVACGPSPMLEAVAKVCASSSRLQKLPVILGLEERMGCGIGICFSCSVWTNDGMKRLCTEGPWFAANEMPDHFRCRGGE